MANVTNSTKIVKTLSQIIEDSANDFWWKKLDLSDLPSSWKCAVFMQDQDDIIQMLNPNSNQDHEEYERRMTNIAQTLDRFKLALAEDLGTNAVNSKWVWNPVSRMYYPILKDKD